MKKIENYINELKENSEILGILLIGSSSRLYKDDLSDQDYEVIVTDDYYKNNNLKVIFIEGRKAEFLYLPISDYEKKIESPCNIDHWPIENHELIYDKDRKIEELTIKILMQDYELVKKKLKLHYFEFIFLALRFEKLLKRGSELNCLMTIAIMNYSVIKLLFLLKGKWPPIIYWAEQNLNEIEYGEISEIMLSLLKEPSKKLLDLLINKVDRELLESDFDFQLSKEDLIEEVVSIKFRPMREKFGIL
ncbi:MAG: hypothetical protein FWG67_02895 [Defluviitaleaceae bacterium]|nr:hypothetical protein [Defluviitaleaceae bacterium]